jgi:prenyltransferase beta subunit
MFKTGKKIFLVSIVLLFTLWVVNIAYGESNLSVQNRESIEKGVNYLKSMQNTDGGFCAKKGRPSSRSLTAWVVLALTGANVDCTESTWAPAGKNPLDYLKNTPDDVDTTCDYAVLLLALTAAGQGSGQQARSLEEKIISFQQEDGQFAQRDKGEEGVINAHIWSVLALGSTGNDIPHRDKARKWLLKHQNTDGGFGWIQGVESDTDDTGAAVQALILMGENFDSPAIKNALRFIKGHQQSNGGFSAGKWMAKEANACSDAWVLQGLIAAGEDPADSSWTVNNKNGISHLLSLQNKDGSFNWKEGVLSSPVTTTSYAIMALAGKPHPVQIQYDSKKEGNQGPAVFSDLSEGYWAYSSIMDLVQTGVLGGYEDKTFRPENRVTRAEFTKFMVSGLGMATGASDGAARFKDIPAHHWARGFISSAVEKGFIQGRPNGTFDPQGKITGGELAAMLVRALPAEKKESLTEGPKWYSGYVKLAGEEGLLYPGFQGDTNATRAQCSFSIRELQKALAK